MVNLVFLLSHQSGKAQEGREENMATLLHWEKKKKTSYLSKEEAKLITGTVRL